MRNFSVLHLNSNRASPGAGIYVENVKEMFGIPRTNDVPEKCHF